MLIGIVGFAHSGKGTVGDIIRENTDFVTDSFAKPLKDAVAVLFGWDRELLEGATKESREWREKTDRYWSEELDIRNFTPRMAMQQFGTECIRDGLHPEFWIKSLNKRWIDNGRNNMIITDCRFPNEIDLVRQSGGKILHVQRGPNPGWYNDILFVNQGLGEEDDVKRIATLQQQRVIPHDSEISWIGMGMDYKIENNGTLEELGVRVKEVLELFIDEAA